ncbi:MAG: LysR family transcriptional regulator, partial [Alteromonadaceae bacterium]
MISPITLDALRVLEAIERKKSFAGAADELFRVPSAISYTISKLEDDLAITLFDRSKRKAELTPVGQMIV